MIAVLQVSGVLCSSSRLRNDGSFDLKLESRSSTYARYFKLGVRRWPIEMPTRGDIAQAAKSSTTGIESTNRRHR